MLNVKLMCLSTVLIVLVLIKNGWSIKCWSCRSNLDPKCSDPFDNITFIMADCKHSPMNIQHIGEVQSSMCRKVRQKIDGVWRYIRGCAYLGEPGLQGDERFCLMRTGTYNIFMEYCTCNSKDGCNGASTLVLPPLLITAAAFVYLVIR